MLPFPNRRASGAEFRDCSERTGDFDEHSRASGEQEAGAPSQPSPAALYSRWLYSFWDGLSNTEDRRSLRDGVELLQATIDTERLHREMKFPYRLRMVSITTRVAVGGLGALIVVLTGCGPTPAGSGELVGRMMGISDVEGMSDYAIGGGELAILPVDVMEGPFWALTGAEPTDDPEEWRYLVGALSESDVFELGGTVASIEEDGDFRVTAPPGEYAVCYWLPRSRDRVSGCSHLELPPHGELMATWGEGGFGMTVKK